MKYNVPHFDLHGRLSYRPCPPPNPKRNPWVSGEHFGGVPTAYCDTESRLARVKRMMPEELKAAIKWPGTQKAVRLAAERRLRKMGRDE